MKTKRKGRSSAIFILCTLLIVLFAFIGINGVEIAGYRAKSFEEVITKGLDLQGGVSVVMEITKDGDVTKDELQQTKESLELRVNKVGVAETVVTTEGDRRIRVDIPGVYDSSEIVDTLGKTGELTFRSPDGETLLTGSDVKSATTVRDSSTGDYQVSLEFNEDGQQKFADATTTYLNQQISIYMDEEELSSPTVNAAITEGKAVISGMGSKEKAQNLAALISAGALPVPVESVSVQTVGAQLGEEALPNALKAGAIGLALIFLFMIIYYKVPGFIADIVLTLYVLLVLLVFVEVGVTLTLPGIAALLLTIGMAVDANVLIFERIGEELKKGITPVTAVAKGFENARLSILDSNITTIIVALVLYFMGSGSVKGFAITLMIGIVISLFTCLYVTKFFMKLALNMGILSKKSAFRVKGDKELHIKVIEKRKIWFAISIAIIVIGLAFTAIRGLNFGIDFKGGTQVTIDFGKEFDKVAVDDIVKKYSPDAVTNTVEDTQYEIKAKDLNATTVGELFDELKTTYELEDTALVSQNEIGASVGKDLTKGSIVALLVAFVAMLIYIAFRFELSFGLAALVALMHDVLITISVYAIFNISINTPFIASILTIIGYSINATIVIFDRIRENRKNLRRSNEIELCDKSINQTMGRSINTTLTTLFTIVSVFIFVPTVREFSLPISLGVICGAYSSIFIASSVWVSIDKKIKSRKKKKAATV